MPVRPPFLARSVLVPALLAPAVLAVLAGCATDPEPSGTDDAAAEAVTIEASDEACDLSSTQLDAGITTFAITNAGQQVTEVYVYAGERIVTEKENIGPGTAYELTVDLTEGRYEVACKPGMVGDGIRTSVDVTAASDAATPDPLADRAVEDYRAYVQGQADLLPPLVEQLRAAVVAGDRALAQSLYAPSRVPWEAIEPVAESFGDLDPRIDVREADLEAGQAFTGWHRIEKALWQGEDLAGVVGAADQLVADVTELSQRTPNAALTAVSIGNGAKELLDEVATGKITGEEEAFSHTDLVDFQANLDGAARAFAVLRPLVERNDPELATTLATEFEAVQRALDPYRTGTATEAGAGFVSYDTVPESGRQDLSRAVDALGEPLSQLAAAVAG